MPTTGSDLYRTITARIVTAIEAGAGPWSLPWRTSGRLQRPTNVATGNRYRGVNVLALWAEAQLQHFSTSTWGTYRQWAAQGCQVRKGEKASTIVFYKPVTRDRDDIAASEEASSQTRLIARASAVFNANQVDGVEPAPAPAPVEPAVIHTAAEQFIAATGASISHGGERACYNRDTDQIRLPPRDSFMGSATSTATESFYSTVLHELVHWTGSKHRLDRDLTGRFGSHAYAMEELVAKLGAAFLCSDLQITNEPRPDHAAYLASWLTVLKKDPRAIFTAASKAAEATDYLHPTPPSERAHRAGESAPPNNLTRVQYWEGLFLNRPAKIAKLSAERQSSASQFIWRRAPGKHAFSKSVLGRRCGLLERQLNGSCYVLFEAGLMDGSPESTEVEVDAVFTKLGGDARAAIRALFHDLARSRPTCPTSFHAGTCVARSR